MSNLRTKPFFASKHWKRVFILSLCFALLAGTTFNASAFHLTKVKNKSFEKDGNKDGIPNHWTGEGLNAKDKRVCNKSKHKKCSFKMVAGVKSKLLFQQALNSEGPEGAIVTLSGWVKGKDLVGGADSRIYMYFHQTDGNNFCIISLPDGTFGWTKFKEECQATKDFDYMTILLINDDDSGKLWFDKVNIKAVAP